MTSNAADSAFAQLVTVTGRCCARTAEVHGMNAMPLAQSIEISWNHVPIYYCTIIWLNIDIPFFYFILALYNIFSPLSGRPNSDMCLSPGPRVQRIDGTIRQKYLRGWFCILIYFVHHQSFKLTDACMWSMDQILRQTILLQTAASLHNHLPHGPPRTQKGCWTGQRTKNEKILSKWLKMTCTCHRLCVSVSFAKLRIRLERMIPAPDAEFISQQNLECHKFVKRSWLLKGKCIKAYHVPCS